MEAEGGLKMYSNLGDRIIREIDGEMYHIAEVHNGQLSARLVLCYPPTVHFLARVVQQSLPPNCGDLTCTVIATREVFFEVDSSDISAILAANEEEILCAFSVI
jgi:hypothetical protein